MEKNTTQGSSVSLLKSFEEWKISIGKVLRDKEKTLRDDFSRVHPLGPDVLSRIIDFAEQGKMIRGGLVCLADGLATGRVSADSFTAGAAIELFQSALLVHDDIMDRDLYRRGNPSVFHQYATDARLSSFRDPDHLGEGLGICAGDIAFFLGFELLTDLGPQSGSFIKIFSRSARELSYVGIAQM
ncbi:MAG: hypothetical protein HN368_07200, partial [Spirochaetales bacterium]|nr:hypothetical protein [Spirochaetales bacterium]